MEMVAESKGAIGFDCLMNVLEQNYLNGQQV
jgi:hypothetical protein